MKKKLLFFISILFMSTIFFGCSTREDNELIELQNGMKKNVAEPMFRIADDFEEKGDQLNAGELTPDEFVDYYETEVEPSIVEMRNYMQHYNTPVTEDAKKYFNVLKEKMNLSLEVLEQSAELVAVLVDESADEDDLFERSKEMEVLGEKLGKKDEEVLEMQKNLADEYNIEFEEIDLGD